jgi:hypothetical protein
MRTVSTRNARNCEDGGRYGWAYDDEAQGRCRIAAIRRVKAKLLRTVRVQERSDAGGTPRHYTPPTVHDSCTPAPLSLQSISTTRWPLLGKILRGPNSPQAPNRFCAFQLSHLISSAISLFLFLSLSEQTADGSRGLTRWTMLARPLVWYLCAYLCAAKTKLLSCETNKGFLVVRGRTVGFMH